MARLRKISKSAIERLGTVPDVVLAAECGISNSAVAQFRRKRGIPSYQPERPWLDCETELLGTMTDAEVALRINRTPKAVKIRRQKMTLPAVRPDLIDYEALKKLCE